MRQYSRKRYVPLLFILLFLTVLVIAGSGFLAVRHEEQKTAPKQQVTVYTTLPQDEADLLAAAYEQEKGVRIDFRVLPPDNILQSMQTAGTGEGSLVLADRNTLDRAAAKGLLASYISESGDQVPDELRQKDGYWTGVWYDPVVFCINQDYLKTLPRIPDSWQNLAKTQNIRIGVTDFLAADAASSLFFGMIAEFGEEETYAIWRQIHPQVAQYSRYLSTPVRQAGMGEVDLAIAVESETLRYVNGGYPLKIIYPADGTAAFVTGTGYPVNAPKREEEAARDFADWLLTDEAQQALQRNDYYFIPASSATLAWKSFAGKNIVFFTNQPNFSEEQKHAFLDRWVKEIRFQ